MLASAMSHSIHSDFTRMTAGRAGIIDHPSPPLRPPARLCDQEPSTPTLQRSSLLVTVQSHNPHGQQPSFTPVTRANHACPVITPQQRTPAQYACIQCLPRPNTKRIAPQCRNPASPCVPTAAAHPVPRLCLLSLERHMHESLLQSRIGMHSHLYPVTGNPCHKSSISHKRP